MKNWKNLFVKTSEGEEEENPTVNVNSNQFSFPVNTNSPDTQTAQYSTTGAIDEKILNEVLSVYEKGVDSINMPGYDFYEFYRAIVTVKNAGEQVYIMAYQMAKSMDGTLSPQKLAQDADFYISKINEVHQQYSTQGQQRINALESKKNEEKNLLLSEIDKATKQITQLRNQLQNLESEINKNRTTLSTIDANYLPQEATVRQKLLANDNARHISIHKLTTVKEGIQKNIK